jgi:hypothetical protein
MKVQEPIPHWNNFTVSDLRDILKHCVALEKLGIAQDEEMLDSIERDIALREKREIECHAKNESKLSKIKKRTVQNNSRTNGTARRTMGHPKKQPKNKLQEQNIQIA